MIFSQVQWIEEKDNIFSKVVGQRDLREFTIDHSSSFELGCRSGDYDNRNYIFSISNLPNLNIFLSIAGFLNKKYIR